MKLRRVSRAGRTRALDLLRGVRDRPTLAGVSAEGLLTRFGFGMVGLALPLYALSIGMDVAEVGLLYALSTGTNLAVKPAMGWAADRFGRKRTLAVAVSLRCLVALLLVFAALPWHLYAIRLLQGAMTAAREPSAAVLIAEHSRRHSRASAFAWYNTARDLGRSLGYAAAGLLIEATDSYRGVFLVAFVCSCAALWTVIQYVREIPAENMESVPAPPPGFSPRARPAILKRGLLGYAGFGLMVATSAEMMRGLFPVIATRYAGLTAGQTGVAVGIGSLGVLLAGPLFGWLSDHVSRSLVLGARSIANTLSSLLYVFVPSFSGFVAGRLLDDTGKAAFRPSWGAVLAEVSDADRGRRARTMAFLDTAHTLGEVIGPLIAGLLMSGFGVPAMLGLRAALSIATEVQAVRLFRRRENASRSVEGREQPGMASSRPS